MLKNLLSFLLSLGLAAALAQPALHLEWEIVRNQHENQNKTLSVLRIANRGPGPLPATGWSLYFNFARWIEPSPGLSAAVRVDHINGDFYRITPAPGFGGLAPGGQLDVPLVSSDWLINASDAPAGFYLVYDAAPERPIRLTDYTVVPSTRPEQWMRTASDHVAPPTGEGAFLQNQRAAVAYDLRPMAVLPAPVSAVEKNDAATLSRRTVIYADADFMGAARLLAADLAAVLGRAPSVMPGRTGKPGIHLVKSRGRRHREGYRLTVERGGGVVIEAGTAAGAFYGTRTLLSLIAPGYWQTPVDSLTVPGAEVVDTPRFAYRGLHLDVARNFHSKETVLRLLDRMALYKLNRFHFHLTDDEGWRLEIPGLPELTGVGARRGHASDGRACLQPAYGSGPDPAKAPGSGFYSRNDFIDILRYAAARHIEVIPEIETPGHARAAIKSMQARYERLLAAGQGEAARQYLLVDPDDRSVYRSVQLYDDNVMDVALPSTYAFLEKVVDELLAMYREAGVPLRTVHIGGDEVPAGVWQRSPAAARLIAEPGGPESTDDLWYYYLRRVADLFRRRGLVVSGWEEIGLRKVRGADGAVTVVPNPDFVADGFRLYVWNNVIGWGAEDLAYRLANAGYPVVLGPVTNLYFDMAYAKDFNEPGYYWGGFADEQKAFRFAPMDYFRTTTADHFGNAVAAAFFRTRERLTPRGRSHILGIQGMLWAENLTSPERLEYMAFPKLLGLAERAWAPAPAWESERDSAAAAAAYAADWSRFANTLGQRELPRLDFYRGGTAYRVPMPGAVIRDGKLYANVQFPGLTLRYTTDGSEPTATSAVYTVPVAVSGPASVRAFDRRGRGGRTVVCR